MKTSFSEFIAGNYANRLITVLERIAKALEQQLDEVEPKKIYWCGHCLRAMEQCFCKAREGFSGKDHMGKHYK